MQSISQSPFVCTLAVWSCLLLLCLSGCALCLRPPRFPRVSSLSGGASLGAAVDLPPVPPATTAFYTQTLDHFNEETPYAEKTFQQRYLYSTEYWTGSFPGGCPGPIFFYNGNESPVTDYWNNSGFFTQVMAPKHNGLLLMMEHRYFGESLPFGNKSTSPGYVGFLEPEQALADYAQFLTDFKEKIMPQAKNCPVINFGGSYGGMLAAWLRLKYPYMTIGALAASAPFAFDGTGVPPSTFMKTCQNSYEDSLTGCSSSIKASLDGMASLLNDASGLQRLAQTFGTCKPLDYNSGYNLIQWVENGLVDMAMLSYPYASDYGVHFPAWPVNATCKDLMSVPSDPIAGMAKAIQNFYNETGTVSCVDPAVDVPDWGKGNQWPYLACTELYFPMEQDGMWYPHTTWNVTRDIQACQQQFGVTTRVNWGRVQYGGFRLGSLKNVIFSNGLVDPWHTSGILEPFPNNPDIHVVVIPAAAHHLDLRAPNPADPIYVTQAREKEESIMAGWISDYWASFQE